jgi:2-polyprenyl-3-methyl-5-hydroxy-6-metoxy-1,4-benzoquinol methylase
MDATDWNNEFKDSPDYVDVRDHILGPELESLSPGTALDLGCGSGRNALQLAQLGWRVVGVDWADHAIGLANQAASNQGLDAAFVVADTTTWIPETEFDLVVSTYALPGGEDSRRVLGTAAKAVAPGGTLIIAEWDKSMAEVWHFDADDLMTPDEIAVLLPGLEVERAEVRRIQAFTEGDPRAYAGLTANVAFVRARRLP